MTLKIILVLGIVAVLAIVALLDIGLAMSASRNRRACEDKEQMEYIRAYHERHAGQNDR
jgi:hypothetical protein